MLQLRYILVIPIILVQIISVYAHKPAGEYKKTIFKHFSVEDGLSQSTVFTILQDSKGFMWLGTRSGGVNKFDGYHFTAFKAKPDDSLGLVSNEILKLYEDSQGLIWAGARDGGLSFFDYNTGKFTTITNNKVQNAGEIGLIVNDICEDNNHNLWVISERGLGYLNASRTLFTSYHSIESNIYFHSLRPIGKHTLLVLGNNEIVLIDTRSGMAKYMGRKIKNTLPNSGKWNAISNIIDSTAYIGHKNGLFAITLQNNQSIKLSNVWTSRQPIIIRDILCDQNKNKWVGTKEGLIQLDTEGNETAWFRKDENDKTSLSHNSVYAIYQDNTSNIWIGTWGGGVNLFSKQLNNFMHVKHYPNTINSLSNNVVSSFAESEDGLFIGTELGGLNFYDYNSKSFTWYTNQGIKNALNSNHVKCLKTDGRVLWIGTFGGGLNKLDITTKKIEHIMGNYRVFDICQVAPNQLWIACMEGLFALNTNTAEYTDVPLPTVNSNDRFNEANFITSLLKGANNTMWIGTKTKGLIRYDIQQQTYTIYRHKAGDNTSISSNYIVTIHKDDSARLWVGTNNGLNLYNPKTNTFINYFESNGLPDNFINSMETDNNGLLWITTNRGLCYLKYKTGEIKSFEDGDGLQSNEFNRQASYKSTNGTLYFGGINGYNYFHPENISVNNNIPEIQITDFKIANEKVTPISNNSPLNKHISATRKIVLQHWQNSFSFDFVALNYISSHKNQYAYYLQGFEKKWKYTGPGRTAVYTNISPGKYIFKVKGSNNDNVWNETGKRITIVVRKPYYTTFIAFVVYFVVVTLILFMIRKIIIFRVEQKNQLYYERAHKKRLEEMYNMKLRFFTNISHEFRTPLTLIASPLEKLINNKEQGEKENYYFRIIDNNVKRLLRLVNQLLDFRKAEHEGIKLRVEQGILARLLEEITNDFQGYAMQRKIGLNFNCTSSTNSQYQWFDHEIVEKVMFNLLSNAFKFTKSGHINVNVELIGDNAIIEVQDTGKGIPDNKLDNIFDRFYSSDELKSEDYQGTGIGLAFTKNIVELHHGSITVKSKVNNGSCFTVTLPVIKEAYSNNELFLNPAETSDLKQDITGQGIEEKIVEEESRPENEQGVTILLVEDNEELRSFIASELDHYTIIEAADGNTAIQHAFKYVPDIVVSDIMMPGLNGLELCEKIKANLLTSHVPVILLTARTSTEQKIEGLKKGADAYIEKPFNIYHLKARIENLLEIRSKLHQHYASHPESIEKGELVQDSAIDSEFLDKINDLVLNNIDNPDFDVESLAACISVSRSQLFRKIKAVAGVGPNELIRDLRLQHAKQLLMQNGMSVKEVAYKTGYSSPSYFVTSFRKKFGITPSEYIAKNELL